MNKPLLIGMTPRKTEVYQSEASYFINSYADYLRAAGIPVLPVMLPVCTNADAMEAASLMDGLLITGGQDVAPEIYGQSDEGTCDCEPQAYDETDILLYTAFRDARKPIYGICRGIQLINAVEGGTLIQDIPSTIGQEHNQRNADPDDLIDGTLHTVTCVPGSRLHEYLGTITRVNSFHHQAVDEPAPGFTVSAYAPDGVIKAIEKDRITAVQWHPERMLDDSGQIRLAAEFLNQCLALHK